MRLATIAAQPAEVLIDGRTVLAPKLTVRSIAVLEAWFARVTPKPDPNDLFGEDWPPALGSQVAVNLLGCGEGMAQVLHASLSQVNPAMTIGDARTLACSMTSAEQDAFFLAVFPAPRLPRGEGDGEDSSPSSGRPMDWHGGMLYVLKTYPGHTIADCLDMPCDQFFSLFADPSQDETGGPRRRWSRPVGSPEQMAKLWEEWKRDGRIN